MSEASLQKAQQLDLQFVLGSKVRVSSFRGKNVMAFAVPEHSGFP